MNDIVTGILAAAGGTTAAGAAYLAHVLRRDRPMIWHPGDDLPEVPAGAPVRQLRGSR